MNDLTEKLKELLIHCAPKAYSSAGNFLDALAQQLAPEIEKMMPRWIPVSERLPEEGNHVLAEWGQGDTCIAHIGDGTWWYRGDMGVKAASVPPTRWMPIPKGPTG